MIAIWRAGLRRWLAPGLGVALTVAWCVAGAPAPPAAAARSGTASSPSNVSKLSAPVAAHRRRDHASAAGGWAKTP